VSGCAPPTITQKALIGDKCAQNADCGSQWFYCITDDFGGYCSKDCKSDADCPLESICSFGSGSGQCHKKCNTTSDCRTNYLCHAASPKVDDFASHTYCDVLSSVGDAGAVTPTDMSKAGDAGGGAGG
jgi:hypothetical protein